tara:strand:- start:35 stop:274 length:240 start_codon:yes stop_codon:yes gene_type:complete
MKLKNLIQQLKKYEELDCDVRVEIDEDNFFDNSSISNTFNKATKLNISDHLSLPNYWVNDIELNKLDESNEIILRGFFP